VVGRNEHRNEPSGFLKAGNFVNPLSDGQIFKEDPASCKLVSSFEHKFACNECTLWAHSHSCAKLLAASS